MFEGKVKIQSIKCIERQQMHFGFMNVLSLHSGHQYVLANRGHLQGGQSKNRYD